MTFQEMPELLTIKEAAHLINVHPNTLRNWEKEGKLQVMRMGSRRDRRFTKASIWQIFEPTKPI
jgi:excisionase family DNA binding protein